MEDQSHAFTREQKAGYAVVILCGVLTLVFGMFYIGHHLQRPFLITYEGGRVLTGDQEAAKEITRQKSVDTDNDGVNDYDELYVYGSSPYLADTDSDGLTDDFEITSGMDPACATGSACENRQNDIVQEMAFVDEDGAMAAAEAAMQAAASADQLAEVGDMLKGLTTPEIRALLLESGADKAELDAMSDEEVQALYTEVVAQLESNGGLDALIEQVAAQSGS